jgi:tetrahydromethanopterin S-methyltransferase subunit B
VLATGKIITIQKQKEFMAKEIAKENPVIDALRKLKDEEAELLVKLKPLQEAIGALEKIVDKSVKKAKPAKENAETSGAEENVQEVVEEAQ